MLTTVQKAKTYLQERVDSYTAVGLLIYHDGTGEVTTATVTVTPTQITLTADATITTFTFADEEVATLSLLAAAINALDGWHADLRMDGSALSTSIVTTATTSVLGGDKAYIDVGPEWLLSQLIGIASAAVVNTIDSPIEEAIHSCIYKGGSDVYSMRYGPVTEVIGVYTDPLSAISICLDTSGVFSTVEITATHAKLTTTAAGLKTTAEVALEGHSVASLATALNAIAYYEVTAYPALGGKAATDMLATGPLSVTTGGLDLQCWQYAETVKRIDFDPGIVHLTVPLAVGNQIKIVYKSGYSEIPAGLEGVVLDLVGALWDRRPRDMSLQAEKMSGYSWKAKEFLISSDIQWRLGPYMQYSF